MNEDLHGRPVRSLQTMLRVISGQIPEIPSVIPDGIYGDDTVRSVTELQRYLRLPVTGIADLATWNETTALYQIAQENFSAPQPLEINLRPGQRLVPGENNLHLIVVDALFQALSVIFSNVPEDTASRLYWLQEISGIEVTGTLDRVTWRYLVGLYRLAVFDGEIKR